MNTIRHTLKAEVLLKMSADEPRPAIEPLPTLEIDPELLAAFLMEPKPEEINLGPLVTLQRDCRIAIENDSDYERITDRTKMFGLGRSNTNDDYSAAEDELETTAGNQDDWIAEEEDDSAVDDSDIEYLELSEGDDDI